jgi:hypothetical protein
MPLITALRRQRQADFWVRGQSGLQSKFQDSQGYKEKPCLEKQNKTKQKKKKKKLLIRVVVVLAFDPSTLEAEAGRSVNSRPVWPTESIPGQPGLHTQKKKKPVLKTKQ